MSDLAPSVIAVIGTLAGTGLAYTFSERSKTRDRRSAQEASSRHERLTVDSEFIAAVTDFRRAKVDEWYATNEKPSDRANLALQDVVRTRVTVRAALARVQLTARRLLDDDVVAAAVRAKAQVDQISNDLGMEQFEALRKSSLDAIDQFTSEAAKAARRS